MAVAEQTEQERLIEAERGYCTEHLGRGEYCLRPAVAEVRHTGPTGVDGLRCGQHVKGWPLSLVTWLDDTAELRERFARSEETRRGAVEEVAEEL